MPPKRRDVMDVETSPNKGGFEHFEESGERKYFLKRKRSMDAPLDNQSPLKKPKKSTQDFWAHGFAEYLETGEFCDVTLRDERGKTYNCHKVILVRKSEYFKTLFLGGFKEREQPLIDITDPDKILDEILKFLYTGSVTVNRSNVSALLNSAELFAIESLTVYVLDNVQIQFESNKDLVFAYYNQGDQSRLAITDFIKSDFESMVQAKCFARLSHKVLGSKALFEILSDNELNVSEEDTVAEVVYDYIQFNEEGLTKDEISLLLTAIRYCFINTSTSMKVYGKFGSLCPQELMDSMVSKACSNEGLPVPPGLKLQKPRGAFSTFNVRPKSNNDSHGLFHWMGRGKSTVGSKWRNPVEAKLCTISSSTNWNGTPPNNDMVGTGISTPPCAALFWADHGQNNWIQFDVNPNNVNNFQLKVSHYAFGYSTGSWMPRNWVFEGSLGSAGPWITLKNHVNDQTFMGPGVCVFDINPAPTQAFRFFRVRNTGTDSSGSEWLGVSSFDLFGETVPLM